MSCLDKFHILEIENLSVIISSVYEKDKRSRSLVISNLNVSVHEEIIHKW